MDQRSSSSSSSSSVVGAHIAAGVKKAHKKARHAVSGTVGKDGYATHAAEHLPVVNNIAWAVHRMAGHEEQAERTKQRNPLGTDGFLTKTAECIPGVSDAIRAVHHWRGQDEAAERARGYSIGRYLSKDGALTKTAELLPGSNIVAALMMEVQGNHAEAKEALNLVRAWKNIGSPDGALAKLAEMFPGTDLIAFGLHASHGEFAHALRSVCKTRYVDITASLLHTSMEVNHVEQLEMMSFDIGDMCVHPVAGPLVGALMDLAGKLVESPDGRSGFLGEVAQLSYSHNVGDSVREVVNAKIAEIITGQLKQLPQTLNGAVEGAEASLAEMRKSKLYKLLLPERLPRPPASLSALLQDLIPRVAITHLDLPEVPEFRPKYKPKYRVAAPEATAAFSCLSFAGCLGLGCHTGLLGCFAGCAAGAMQGLRYVSSSFVPRLNAQNDTAWADAERPRLDAPFGRRSTDSLADMRDRAKRHGIVVDVPDVPALLDAIGEYVFQRVLASWRLGRVCSRLLRWLLPALRRFLGDLINDADGAAQVALCFSVPSQSIAISAKDTLVLPEIPFAIVVDLQLAGQGPPVTRLRAALPDSILGSVIDDAVANLADVDYRNMDPRLAGFVEPVHALFNLELVWDTPTLPKVVIDNFRIRLALPS